MRTSRSAGKAVDTFFTTVSEEYLLNEPGMQPLRKKLLKLALPYYQTFASRGSDDPRRQVALARAYLNWGTITGEIGSKDESKAILKTAVSHFERLLESDPTNLDVRIGLAQSYQALADQLVFTDEPREGLQAAQRAADVWAGVVRDRPDDPEWPQMLGRSHDIAAIGHIHAFGYAVGKAECQKAIAVLTAASERLPRSLRDATQARPCDRQPGRGVAGRGRPDRRRADEHSGAESAGGTPRGATDEQPTSARSTWPRIVGEIGKDRWLLGSLRPAEADLEESRHLIDKVVERESRGDRIP